MEPDAYVEMAAAEEAHWWFQGRRKNLATIIAGLGLSKAARILELGAGTGGNLEMLSYFGTVTAVESSELARGLAMRKTAGAGAGAGAVRVLAGFLPDGLPDFAQKFDLVCLFDVLEHIEQDEQTLLVIKDLLAPGGVMVITVPAFAKLWGPHDEKMHHKRRYGRAELQAKLCRAGFTIEKLSYSNMFLFPAALAMRLVDRLAQIFAKDRKAGGSEILPTPINWCFTAVFGAERFLLKHMNLPIGLSLLAVAHSDRNPPARRRLDQI